MKEAIMETIMERASKKTKDGVYTCKGHPYAVVKGRLRFVGDFNQVLEISHGFAVIIGVVKTYELESRIRQLTKEVENND